MTHKIFIFLFHILILSGCSSITATSRHNTSTLEKPPGYENANLVLESKDDRQVLDSDKNFNKGLFSDVYKVEGADTELRIKRNVEEAWVLVGKAILINDFRIKGRNRKQGIFQLSYKASGLLDGFGLFGDSGSSTYSIKLVPSNNETSVIISKVEDENDYDPGRLMDGVPDYSYDSSAKLSELIYQSLRNDVQN